MLLENHQSKARHDGDNIRVRWEALKWRRRGVIEELAWDVSKAQWMCVRSMSLLSLVARLTLLLQGLQMI
jgi:hypothetical protein